MKRSDLFKKERFLRRAKFSLLFIVLLALYGWAIAGIQFNGMLDTAWPVTKSIVQGFLTPDTSYIYNPEGEDLLRGLLETLAIAIVGICLSIVLAIPIGLWAAKNLSSTPLISQGGKSTLSFIRTLPDIILALLFIKVVGPGAYAGMLALGIGAIGMLGKLYAEEVEAMDPGPVESIVAVGGNKLEQLAFGVIPQVLPGFISATLYRFEINMRSAATLGVIGAGGIGTPLIFAIQARNWDRVGMIMIGIVLVVLIVDWCSSALRKRVL
ncbi:phosphonate ABC transporter, permease protein PhnE [Halalkalibacterium halodurans]|uniref:Phosphate ABC transporter permease n=1 Tax=Halalkalibacterium halodurans TaxID=86665 RepID=A0A0M0KDP8_ALKHA|nr:phosphonate ABC transporter, permease protein PhnE [Halalkalibacterium halodurans]MDY7220943.1 phosphonate ABC transporter, permease protein PhnE [Halalkalibacterium halodurans]MDY7240182.1 phosphonate ABC transporter, permease protein PhnE [Halalkalibacterium halodurans]MED4164226.1 phosphonate ABC transporter, permease protein PhnE [Halalkalibacterium halodurans]TPE69759.1 phosphonate ABC transporter, permease protein PhnE [Halalkalibacterium halodurans]